MPNWCANDLTITGPAPDLDRFVAGGLDFNTAIPYPAALAMLDDAFHAWKEAHPYGSDAYNAHFAERPRDGYNQGGYEWCVEHWGCKWNSGENAAIVRVSETKATATFDTPWSPPTKVVDAWSKAYPALTFSLRFYECGMAFKGHYKAKSGEVLVSMTGKYTGNRGG